MLAASQNKSHGHHDGHDSPHANDHFNPVRFPDFIGQKLSAT
jgi:hypothetical protein